MPAPKHKPNAIHKPILFVAFPIIIPASNPMPAPKDIFDSFILKLVFSQSKYKNYLNLINLLPLNRTMLLYNTGLL